MQHSFSLEEVISLHKNGLTNKEISLKLGTSYETVRKILKSVGLRSKFRVPLLMIDQDHAKCKKCNDVKNIKEFQIGNRGKENQYHYAFCNSCRNKKVYNQLSDNLEAYLTEIYRKICKRSKNKTNLISKEDFISQYHSQDGKCFYSDEELICVRGQGFHRNGLSVDKIIPERDYVKGNIVFCCRKINVCKNDLSLDEIKQWMPSWFERINKFLNLPRDPIT